MVLRPDHEERSWKTFRWHVYKATYESTRHILERSSHSGWHVTPTSRRLASRLHWFVGHCFCNKKLIISDLILWKLLSHRKGKRPLNYIDAVSHDTSTGYEELTTATGESIHISVSSTQKRFSPVNVKQQSR